jgi:hypothetical protein
VLSHQRNEFARNEGKRREDRGEDDPWRGKNDRYPMSREQWGEQAARRDHGADCREIIERRMAPDGAEHAKASPSARSE